MDFPRFRPAQIKIARVCEIIAVRGPSARSIDPRALLWAHRFAGGLRLGPCFFWGTVIVYVPAGPAPLAGVVNNLVGFPHTTSRPLVPIPARVPDRRTGIRRTVLVFRGVAWIPGAR